MSTKRIIVQAGVYDEFLRRYREQCATIVAGDPFDPAVTLGPLSSLGQAEMVNEQLRAAVAGGATATRVGPVVPATGAFVQPTILTDVAPSNPLYGEEIFGPVPMLFRAEDDEDAIRLANDTRYGLGGSVFSTDHARAERVALRLDTGMVWINHPAGTEARLPFGGTKQSGYGTELGREGLYQFLNSKLINQP